MAGEGGVFLNDPSQDRSLDSLLEALINTRNLNRKFEMEEKVDNMDLGSISKWQIMKIYVTFSNCGIRSIFATFLI